MIPRLRVAWIIIGFVALALGDASRAAAEPMPVPTVVTVDAAADASGEHRALGFVTEREGFVLTTYHTLVDPDTSELLTDLTVTLRADGRRFPARIVGVEPTIDLAVLEIVSDETFEPSSVKRERALDVGSEIYVPTTLDGQDLALARGRVAGLNTRECYQESLTSTMFRAEIALPVGATGGPVFTKEGAVIGLYTAYAPEAEEGHVDDPDELHILPIFLAFNIYDSIKQKRSLESPWTGFSVRSLNDDERAMFPASRGHRGGIGIEHVWPKSPAERMGIQPGDVLVQFSHNRIESVGDFQKWLYMYGVDAPVKLVFVRDGEYLVVDYVIEERPTWAKPR